MHTFLSHLFVPVLVAVATAGGALYSIWVSSEKFESLEQLFLDPAAIAVFILATLSILQSSLNYIEKKKENRRATYSFRLRRIPEPAFKIETKLKQSESASGLLTVRIENKKDKVNLLQRQVGYREIIEGQSELHYIEDTECRYASQKSFRKSLFRVLFEPTDSSFWTRNLYNKDDLADALEDAPVTEKGERQVLIYTHTLESRVSEWLSQFPCPEKVNKIKRIGLTANNERALPNILSLASHLSFFVNRELILELATKDINFYHHFAIGGVLSSRGRKKFSLFYAVEAAIEIDKSGRPIPANWNQDSSSFNEKMIEAISSGDNELIMKVAFDLAKEKARDSKSRPL
ncbi:hypothetical protein NIZ92_10120 [Alcaligenes sp. 1735tsa3]|uniref:hypothetical protein n=1 Tax=Alcaligenes sp. 1735tsa3 TaxID=2953809 RepID=UPI0020A746AB|nr:hypothetical protein [Alcaligenes sp. 1735tsa3]USY23687.1 hypothetical protein NIZ92_10120 [Alcaligenes sp. 1735tsa3]